MCVHNNSVGLGPHFTITPGYRLSARNHALSAVVLLIKHFLFSRARRGPLEREVAHVWPSADLATRWLYRPSNEVDHLLSLSLFYTRINHNLFKRMLYHYFRYPLLRAGGGFFGGMFTVGRPIPSSLIADITWRRGEKEASQHLLSLSVKDNFFPL